MHATAANVNTSVGLLAYSKLASRRVTAMAPIAPTAVPTTASVSVCRTTIERTDSIGSASPANSPAKSSSRAATASTLQPLHRPDAISLAQFQFFTVTNPPAGVLKFPSARVIA